MKEFDFNKVFFMSIIFIFIAYFTINAMLDKEIVDCKAAYQECYEAYKDCKIQDRPSWAIDNSEFRFRNYSIEKE